MGKRFSEARSVRAFAFEVGVVVVGVLIALGAQELVSAWSWGQRVANGEALLRMEAERNSFVAIEQIRTAPCVVAQIEALETRMRSARTWGGVPTSASSAGPLVLRVPLRSLHSSAWQSLIDEGTVTHFDALRGRITGASYALNKALEEQFDRSQMLIPQLGVLAGPFEVDSRTRLEFLQILDELKFRTRAQALISAQLLIALRELDRMPEGDTIAQTFGKASRDSTEGECQARGLPLEDWESVVAREAAR